MFLSSIIEELRSDGVEHIQGFPKPKTDDPWTGPESTFVKAGFTAEVEGEFPVYNPHLGEDQVARHLNKRKGIELSKGTVRAVWNKNNMQTIALRQRAAKKSKKDSGLPLI